MRFIGLLAAYARFFLCLRCATVSRFVKALDPRTMEFSWTHRHRDDGCIRKDLDHASVEVLVTFFEAINLKPEAATTLLPGVGVRLSELRVFYWLLCSLATHFFRGNRHSLAYKCDVVGLFIIGSYAALLGGAMMSCGLDKTSILHEGEKFRSQLETRFDS